MKLIRSSSLAVALATGLLFTQTAMSQTDTDNKSTGQKVESGAKKAAHSVENGTKKLLHSAKEGAENLGHKVKHAMHRHDSSAPESAQATSPGQETGCMKLSDATKRQQCQDMVNKG